MILSKTHRFIFIKGLKVGGTSVEIALSSICGVEDIVCPITPIDELKRLEVDAGARNYSQDRGAELAYLEGLLRTATSDLQTVLLPEGVYFNHMSLRDVLRLQEPEVSDYRVLCVERHPYAKVISWANHMLTINRYMTGGEMRSDWRELKNYLEQTVEDGSVIAVKNIDRYRRPDGSVSAYVMRFENLDGDFQKFVSSLGIAYCPKLPHAKKGVLASHMDARDLLNKQQIARINEFFQEEFDMFQYEPL